MPVGPPLVVSNAAQLRCIFSMGNEVAINVYGCRVDTATQINQALANTLGTAIKGAWTSNLATVSPASTSLQRVGIKDIRSANLPEFRDTGAVTAGTGVGDALPATLAQLMTLRTALAGKSFRGRTYVGGFTEAENTATGETLTGLNSAVLAYMQAIQTALANNGLHLAVLSRPADRVQIVTTTFHSDGSQSVKTVNHAARSGAINDVTAFEIRSARWGSQRRRQNG